MTKETTPPRKGELDAYQAAALVGMSPRLIAWFASYAPKQGSDRKLEIRKSGDTFYVARNELVAFNDWLKLPWPHAPGARPPIPKAIRDEIREEALGACAMCQAHANTCEAAHIDPVAKSKNNHPENLIWLCANHHTRFDKTGFAPPEENRSFVVSFKHTLSYHRRAVWEFQGKITGTLFSVLRACESLQQQLADATTADQVNAVEALAKSVLASVPKLAPTSKTDPGYAAFKALKPDFEALAKKSTTTQDLPETLQFAATVKSAFAKRAGYVDCPLCEGTAVHKGEDCPACSGEASVTAARAAMIDLDRYSDVRCPLCRGKRTFKGADCPACSGNGEMERRYADQIDSGDWDDVDCSVCDGSGKHRGEDCPVCAGGGVLERRQRDRIDERDYGLVDCPICEGSGVFRGDDCPECQGHQQMEKRHADQADPRQFDQVRCPVCEGSGQFDDRDCRGCGGQGELDRRYADQIDMRDYKMVECPVCRGGGEYCQTCGGEGEVRRWIADQF